VTDQPTKRGWLSALPLAGFALLTALFLYMFEARQDRDPSVLPSPLIGRTAPIFNLEPLPGSGKPGLSDVDLHQGHTTIINLFASWCGPCRIEHPSLRLIAENAVLKRGQSLCGRRPRPQGTRGHRLGSDGRAGNLHCPRRRNHRI
jgi:cytochrome c biogenesis protein CcmG/thiol:disulfide interchange protein DsbE